MRLKQLVCLLLLGSVAFGATTQITKVNVVTQQDTTVLTVQANGEFVHNEYRKNDAQMMIDFPGVGATVAQEQLRTFQAPGLKGYRVVVYAGPTGMKSSRLELALTPGAKVSVNEGKGALTLHIVGEKSPGETAAAPAPTKPAPTAAPAKPVAAATGPAASPVRTPVTSAAAAPSPRQTPPSRAKAAGITRVQSVSVTRGPQGAQVEIVASQPITAKTLKLKNPDRVVLDIADSVPSGRPKAVAVHADDVVSVRMARFSAEPPVTRVVIDLAQPCEFDVTPNRNRLVVKLHSATAARTASTPATVKSAAEETVPVNKAEAAAPVEQKPKAEPALLASTQPMIPAASNSESKSAKDFVMVPDYQPKADVTAPKPDPVPAKHQTVPAKPPVKIGDFSGPPPQATSTQPVQVMSAPPSQTTNVPPSQTMIASQTTNVPPSQTMIASQTTNVPPSQTMIASQTTNVPPSQTPSTQPSQATSTEPSHTTIAQLAQRTPNTPTPVQPAVNFAAEQRQQTPAGPAKPRYTGEPISVNLKDVDIKDFFRLIHEISGLNVVLDPGVRGALTLVLDDVPWDQALDIVLKNNGLDRQLDGNVLRIATLDSLKREADARRAQSQAQALAVDKVSVTRFLSYAHADDVLPTVKKLLSARGDVISDKRTNALVIQDIPTVIPEIDKLLTILDRKTQEVEIEARVVAATRSYARDIGTQLGLGWGNGVTGVGGINATGTSPLQNHTPTAPNYPVITGGQGAIPLFSNFGLTQPTTGIALTNATNSYRIDALLGLAESRGLLKILSRPRVVTQNNIQALVRQGLRIPIVTAGQLGGPATVTYIDAFLRLTVTPQITAEGTIFLNVDVENTTPDFGRMVQGNPALITQQATTQVLVTDGGTVVLGGVIQTNNSTNVVQTPLLGDVPILGNLFKRRSISTSTQELIFFITPKVIQT